MTKPRQEMNEQELREALSRCEAELAKAQQATNAKTEFLATMSHEIRTPMNAVIGIAHILAASKPLTERQQECVTALKTSADGLMALINDLLDIAKIENSILEIEAIPFDLSNLMHEVIRMMAPKAAEKKVALTFDDREFAHRAFLGDPSRIRQIVLNLCSNAVKFTEKGSIDCRVECLPSATSGTEKVIIRVRDTGIGIAADKLDSIFTKFAQGDSTINRKYGGTGLGLAICKMLAEAMGGQIAVASELGTGSEFTVTFVLPIATMAMQSLANTGS